MKTALVFGGAFNPPTIAHVSLANDVRKKLGYDVVIFVPSKMTYIEKDQGKNFAFSDEVRYEMLQDIAKHNDWMVVSDYELKCQQQPRTYVTLQHFAQEGYQCKLLFGSDKLLELEHGWKHIQEIAREFGFVCMTRNHEQCEEIISNDPYLKTLEPMIQVVHTTEAMQDISSSKVRKLYLEQKYDEIEKYVPKELNGLRNYKVEV